MKEKLILTDCDGVLLHWEWMFDVWMKRHGYTRNDKEAYDMDINYDISRSEAEMLVKVFNEAVYIANLPPYMDAIKYVKKLHEDHGYVFHVITSISSDPLVAKSRTENLYAVFGSSPFFRIDCVDDKEATLSEYKNSNCWWVEDHVKNYELGIKLGLSSVMMTQHYNKNYPAALRVGNWSQLYNLILSEAS